jgi:tetratricopeptide (TPR) repeat protein
MKTARAVALCALCSSVVSFAGAPRLEEKYELKYEETLTCLPAAKPFFNRAWDALANVHTDEARELFTQTVAVDPTCTLAWAHLGALTTGPNGRRMVEDAIAGSSSLSEQERLQVLALAAQHRGDHEAALALIRSALIYDPRSYRLNFAVAQRAGVLRHW